MKNITTFTQYPSDRDIPSRMWDCYMKKYSKKYQLVKGNDGIWGIKCSLGRIEPYGLIRGYLMFTSVMMSTKNKKTYFVKKLPNFIKITQEGDWEISFNFPEDRLKELEDILKIRKRVKLSKEERLKRADRMNKARALKNNKEV